MVGSQRHTYPPKLHQVILEGRQTYQNLITYAIQTAEAFSRETDKADKEVNGEEEAGEEVDKKALLEVLSAAKNSDASRDPIPVKRQRGRKPKKDRFTKLLALPNVHADLHLADMAREYSTVINLSVLAGELKHKIFKRIRD